MANTALGNQFYGLVLVKPDFKEIQKANYQSLACHTGPENDLVASLWPRGGPCGIQPLLQCHHYISMSPAMAGGFFTAGATWEVYQDC